MEISVGARGSVRYLVEVRYSECPLVESPLYQVMCTQSLAVYDTEYSNFSFLLDRFLGLPCTVAMAGTLNSFDLQQELYRLQLDQVSPFH